MGERQHEMQQVYGNSFRVELCKLSASDRILQPARQACPCPSGEAWPTFWASCASSKAQFTRSIRLQTNLTFVRENEHKYHLMYGLTGTFARFQPATADFQKDVGAEMEAVLEAALHARSSLSQGDWVNAQHAGQSYALRVQHLQPEAAVSVIGESGSTSMPAPRQLVAHLQHVHALAWPYGIGHGALSHG